MKDDTELHCGKNQGILASANPLILRTLISLWQVPQFYAS